jgi:hypothetical protein
VKVITCILLLTTQSLSWNGSCKLQNVSAFMFCSSCKSLRYNFKTISLHIRQRNGFSSNASVV